MVDIQQPIPDQIQPQSQPKPDKSFKIQTWEKIAACVVVLIVCAYVLSAQYFRIWPFTVSIAPSLTLSPTASPDPLAGWQTYHNDEYGFELKLPDNFITGSSESFISFYYFQNYEGGDKYELRDGDLFFSISSGPDNLDAEVIKNLIDTREYKFGIYEGIGGKPKEVVTSPDSSYEVYILKGESSLKIWSSYGGTQSEDLFNQILSTLKFID